MGFQICQGQTLVSVLNKYNLSDLTLVKFFDLTMATTGPDCDIEAGDLNFGDLRINEVWSIEICILKILDEIQCSDPSMQITVLGTDAVCDLKHFENWNYFNLRI